MTGFLQSVWVRAAAGSWLLLLLCHLAGWKAHAAVLSGMGGSLSTSLAGVIYALAYFGAVLCAPVFVLSEVLLQVARKVLGRRS